MNPQAWWRPFAYFAPSMGLFFLYPLTPNPWVNATVDFILVFGFATINFIVGVWWLVTKP
jgi:hypothetical protein